MLHLGNNDRFSLLFIEVVNTILNCFEHAGFAAIGFYPKTGAELSIEFGNRNGG